MSKNTTGAAITPGNGVLDGKRFGSLQKDLDLPWRNAQTSKRPLLTSRRRAPHTFSPDVALTSSRTREGGQ
jgi:hypothetical protein